MSVKGELMALAQQSRLREAILEILRENVRSVQVCLKLEMMGSGRFVNDCVNPVNGIRIGWLACIESSGAGRRDVG